MKLYFHLDWSALALPLAISWDSFPRQFIVHVGPALWCWVEEEEAQK